MLNINKVENNFRQNIVIANMEPVALNLQERMKFYKVPAVSVAVVNNTEIEWSKASRSLFMKE